MKKRSWIKPRGKRREAQERKNAKYKETLSPICAICGGWGWDLAHLLPRSTFPEHITKEENLVIMCRPCHNLYDNDLKFRKHEVPHLVERVKRFDPLGANRYFDL